MRDFSCIRRHSFLCYNQIIFMKKSTVTTDEIMEFLRDHMVMRGEVLLKDQALSKEDAKQFATKDDLFLLEDRLSDRIDLCATKEEMHAMESRITTNIDQFVQLHQTMDVELLSLRSKCDRLDERLTVVERKVAPSV